MSGLLALMIIINAFHVIPLKISALLLVQKAILFRIQHVWLVLLAASHVLVKKTTCVNPVLIIMFMKTINA